MKRLISLDHLRGLAIVGVVFAHAFIFNQPPPGAGTELPDILWVNILVIFITYFMAWAGMFAIISGSSNTISLYGGLQTGKLTNPKQVLVSSIFSGMIIIIINYVYLYLFSPGWVIGGVLTGGYLPSIIRTGQNYPRDPNLLFSTALIMIGWSILLSGIVLYFLTKKDGMKKLQRNYRIIFVLATACIFLYPIIDALTANYLLQPLTGENFLPRLILHWIVGEMDPILPYFGFALYGVIFGMMLVENAPKRRILIYGYGLGGVYTIFGMCLVTIYGFDIPAYAVPPLPTLLLMLGPMLLMFTVALHLMDLRGDEKKAWWVKRFRTLRRGSVVSLSLFILEGVIAQIMRHLIRLVYPGFDGDFLFMFFIFSSLNLVVWILILKQWEKIDFKYSLEWFLIAFARKVTGKASFRLGSIRKLESYVGVEEGKR